MKHHFLYLIILLIASKFHAQSNDSTRYDTIREVIIAAAPTLATPWSSTIDTMTALQTFQPSVKTLFDSQLGVLAMNGENFAQDVRISIRGFGSRAAFGIRGIRMYMDDIPLTTPDGTTQVDELSIYDIDRVQVIRSGLAATLGNAGGGTVLMYSPEMQNTVNFTSRLSQYGSIDVGAQVALGKNKQTFISTQHMRYRGKRQHSQAENTTIYATHKVKFSHSVNTKFVGSTYNSPVGQDPGALLLSEFDTSRYMANRNNLRFNAGESVKGALLGQHTQWKMNNKWSLLSTMYYRWRDFLGVLPTSSRSIIDLDRHLFGTQHRLQWSPTSRLLLSLVHQLEQQRDLRIISSPVDNSNPIVNFENFENFYHQSIFSQLSYNINKWTFEGVVKYSLYRFGNEINGEDIDEQYWSPINGMMGLSYKLNSLFNIYGQSSTSFELPTLNEVTSSSELVTSEPLNPERAWHKEVGFRYSKNKIDVEMSLYQIDVKDLITNISFDFGSYFKNVGQQDRKGIDTRLNYTFSSKFNANISYIYADYRNPTDNTYQTLIPKHRVMLGFNGDITSNLGVNLLTTYNSKTFLTSTNEHFIDGYVDGVLSILYKFKKVEAIINISNLYNDAKYANLRANNVTLRFYEAANPRNISLGIKYRI